MKLYLGSFQWTLGLFYQPLGLIEERNGPLKKMAEYSYNHECNHLEIKAIIIDLIPEVAGTMFNTPTLNYNYITRL